MEPTTYSYASVSRGRAVLCSSYRFERRSTAAVSAGRPVGVQLAVKNKVHKLQNSELLRRISLGQPTVGSHTAYDTHRGAQGSRFGDRLTTAAPAPSLSATRR